MNKYGQFAESSDSNHYNLHLIISFEDFEDIEHVLQCIKEIDDFFAVSQYGSKYLLKRKLVFQYDPRRPWGLESFTDGIKVIRKILEDDVFENYAWNHSADSSLSSIFDELIKLLENNSKEIHVFTTNYDRAVEEYCSKREKNCRCIDGFQLDEYSNRRLWAGSYSYPKVDNKTTNVYLYKLHGSLNWKRHKIYDIEATSEERRSYDSNYVENLLVYPTLSPKDGAEVEPYKTIREEFRKYMEGADLCIIIGFSFRDMHVNTIFSDFLKRGKKMILVSPSAYENIYINLFKRTSIPEPVKVTPKTGRGRTYFNRIEKNIITIDQPVTSENSTEVCGLIAAAKSILQTAP
jgi:NAD-dependent SIR2 family protein deacetylase